MNTFEKADFIRDYLNLTNGDRLRLFHKGWYEIIDLHQKSVNLSYEFMLEVEKEVNSIYDLICKSKAVGKETRIPALHAKATLHRFCDEALKQSPYPRHFLRVNDDSEEGFTDYAITNYDLEIMILDSSAEFIKNEKGNFLDYTKDSLSPSA